MSRLPYAWAYKSKNGYEVTTAGDKRFSAFCARLRDSRIIEDAYQLDVKGYRQFGNNWRLGKGKPPLVIRDVWPEYLALWQQWASENPSLMLELSVLAAGKKLTDKYAKTPINQAHALCDILNSYFPPKD